MIAASLFVAAGGFVHLREWLDLYRALPANTPGAAVVQVGFPVNAAVSAVLALALLVVAFRGRRLARYLVPGVLLFQVGSLASLVVSRTGSLFGWAEPIWTRGADQARAVEIGALISLAAVVAVTAAQRRQATRGQVLTLDSGNAEEPIAA